MTIPLSLYIHLPWCVRKCPYCDFNSHALRDPIPEDAYIAALTEDLETHLPHIWGRSIYSIFFGGGTPSLFSVSAIEKIMTMLRSRLRFGQDTEVTLEANPGTIDEARFKGFRQAGINRLSIGIQSLQDDKLHTLGRIHGRDQALRAIESAINAGFQEFNLDLMHGLPAQTIDEALSDLHDALAFKPPHLSWYQLTLEPNTFFFHKPPVLPDEDTLWNIQEEGQRVIQHSGLHQYEVSAYAKPDHQCLHNRNYWEFGDYLGIGAGAHSKITDFENQCVRRHWQVKNPKDYLKSNKTAHTKILTPKELSFEFMLNALRLIEGVPLALFSERTGLPIESIQDRLNLAVQKNYWSMTLKKFAQQR